MFVIVLALVMVTPEEKKTIHAGDDGGSQSLFSFNLKGCSC